MSINKNQEDNGGSRLPIGIRSSGRWIRSMVMTCIEFYRNYKSFSPEDSKYDILSKSHV